MVGGKVEEMTRQLRESKEKYRFLFENSGDIIFTLDKNGIITSFNREAEKTTGYARKEVLGKSFVDVLAFEGRKQLEMGRFRKRLDITGSKPYEAVMRTRSGEKRYVLANSLRLKDERGEVMGLACILRDVTDHKRVEQETSMAEYLLEKVVDNIADGIVMTDKKGLITFFNKGASEIFGHHASDILGKPVLDLYVREKDAKKVKQMLLKSKEGKISDFETQFLTRDGKIVFVNMSATLIRDEEGKVAGTLGINRDITQRKMLEGELKESEERYRTMVESAHDMVAIIGEDSRLKYVNKKAEELTAYSREELRGMDFRYLLNKRGQRSVMDRFRKKRRGERVPVRYEFEIIRKDGEKRRVESSSSNLMDADGSMNTIAYIKDITERKRYEIALKEKLEELEKWYKLTVDRELKMIELKNEIRALANELTELKQTLIPSIERKT
ncbi:MAG: PAS domain S-box protein [Syntrophobacterales bacterium]|nr:MAG: PAS domain S-box protein [Syntrophobacterales bacterium]